MYWVHNQSKLVVKEKSSLKQEKTTEKSRFFKIKKANYKIILFHSLPLD